MMTTLGLIAFGFLLGVVITVLFGRWIVAHAHASMGALMYDAKSTIAGVEVRLKNELGRIETGLHRRIVAVNKDVASAAAAVAQDVHKPFDIPPDGSPTPPPSSGN
jgi:hypothetical protein